MHINMPYSCLRVRYISMLHVKFYMHVYMQPLQVNEVLVIYLVHICNLHFVLLATMVLM